MSDATKFFELLDKAGQLPTIVNRELGIAIECASRDDAVSAGAHATTATLANDRIGAALAALEAWGKVYFAVKIPHLAPGMVVADVGGAAYTGSISPSALSVEDWRVFSQNYERMNFYAIFSSSPAGQEKDPADGRSLHQGDLAQAVDLAAYRAKGGLLAPYL